MDKLNITTICNSAIGSQKPEMKDWGFSFMATAEIDALRIAYAYRNSPHGVKVEHCPNVEQYMVTIFNERANAMGIDGAKEKKDSAGQLQSVLRGCRDMLREAAKQFRSAGDRGDGHAVMCDRHADNADRFVAVPQQKSKSPSPGM